jgi:GR25 family glycosyltransferase involved in LPS biosynthesis
MGSFPFDRSVYINLDRRPDRRQRIDAQVARLGWPVTRVAAFDGRDPEWTARFDAYRAARGPSGADDPASPSVARPHDDDHAARVRRIEGALGRPALKSAGEIAYLACVADVLRRAHRDGVARLLLLEDDVLLHRRAADLLPRMVARLPADWCLLSLGNMSRVSWKRRLLGLRDVRPLRQDLVGCHAIALAGPVLGELAALSERADAPLDIGAMTTLVARHPGRCFHVVPPIAVQPLDESDIQSAAERNARTAGERWRRYGWRRRDFQLP